MTSHVSTQAAASLRTYIDNATTSEKPALPGAIVHVINGKGNTIFTHAAGGTSPLSKNTVMLLHSTSKIVGAIAFLQLVERGLATLDDPSVVANHLPELWNKKVLTGFEEDGKTPILVDRTNDITPRMLMDHSNGTGHGYFNTLMQQYLAADFERRNEVADPHQTILDAPLMWQPGLDWLAVLIERLAKQNLADYLDENVFKPLGLKHIGFEETYGGDATTRPANEGLFWPRHLKHPDGTYIAFDQATMAKVDRPTAFPEGKYHTFPLGTGLAANAKELARILAILLPSNAGTDPISGARILSPSSVKEITSPSLPPQIRNSSRMIPSASPILLPANLEAAHMDPDGSYGLACGVQGAERVLQDGKRGRSKGSIYWYGAANTDFWVDGEKDFVVVAGGNYFPWNDEEWLNFIAGVEGRLYAGLEA